MENLVIKGEIFKGWMSHYYHKHHCNQFLATAFNFTTLAIFPALSWTLSTVMLFCIDLLRHNKVMNCSYHAHDAPATKHPS